ncbi:MAG: class I SAM-dependent methyltransferase [Mariprofundales bacterium]|nr:class I SAM-dependent methyltransferase [Mariprofundales bacterium]
MSTEHSQCRCSAHHRAITKQQWLRCQRHELARWQGKAMLECEMHRLQQRLLPLCDPYLQQLDEKSEILEIGSGPTCFSQWIEKGHKTFVDPLLEDLRRTYPGTIPKGRYLTSEAEKIPLTDHSIDLIICINALSFVYNPEIALHEMGRLLRDGATVILCAKTASSPMARLHYTATRIFPAFYNHVRPYRFTLAAMRRMISRHLTIHEEITVGDHIPPWNMIADHEQIFICSSSPPPLPPS